MGIHLLSASHSTTGLDEIAEAARSTPSVIDAYLESGRIDGAFLLSTCNRVDVLIDSEESPDALTARLGPVRLASGQDAIRHVFRVACGLDSMVVGEREIAGQFRRAADVAASKGALTPLLKRILHAASAASRRVAAATGLAGRGRSIVDIALALAEEEAGPLAGGTALLIGTGSYAGASVAALRGRGVRDIRVHSASGRAEAFSRGHGTRPVDAEGLPGALRSAGLVVACRGSGQPVLSPAQLEEAVNRRAAREGSSPLLVLDLALDGDIEADSLPRGVRRIDLAEVAIRLPAVERAEVEAAEGIIEEALTAFERQAEGADVNAAVVELRSRAETILAEELSRLSPLGPEEAARTEKALRHLAARLIDAPCRRARTAIAEGAASAYLEGLDLVLGIRPREGARA